ERRARIGARNLLRTLDFIGGWCVREFRETGMQLQNRWARYQVSTSCSKDHNCELTFENVCTPDFLTVARVRSAFGKLRIQAQLDRAGPRVSKVSVGIGIALAVATATACSGGCQYEFVSSQSPSRLT